MRKEKHKYIINLWLRAKFSSTLKGRQYLIFTGVIKKCLSLTWGGEVNNAVLWESEHLLISLRFKLDNRFGAILVSRCFLQVLQSCTNAPTFQRFPKNNVWASEFSACNSAHREEEECHIDKRTPAGAQNCSSFGQLMLVLQGRSTPVGGHPFSLSVLWYTSVWGGVKLGSIDLYGSPKSHLAGISCWTLP